MRLPRDVSGDALVRALGRLGDATTRQTGSHVRLTTERYGEHHVTVPRHDPLRPGTLRAILNEVGALHGLEREERPQLSCAGEREVGVSGCWGWDAAVQSAGRHVSASHHSLRGTLERGCGERGKATEVRIDGGVFVAA